MERAIIQNTPKFAHFEASSQEMFAELISFH